MLYSLFFYLNLPHCMQITFPQTITYTCALISNKSRTTFVSVSAMLVYIHQKKYRSSFILERYFFVSIYPAANPGTYLMVFLVVALLLCL